MVKYGWSAPFIHPFQDDPQLVKAVRHFDEELSYAYVIAKFDGANCTQDERDHFCAACLDGNRYDEEPSLIVGAGERVQYGEIIGVCEIFRITRNGSEVPQVECSICRARRKFEMRRNFQKWTGD
jgi:hypothetical protein